MVFFSKLLFKYHSMHANTCVGFRLSTNLICVLNFCIKVELLKNTCVKLFFFLMINPSTQDVY